MGLLGLSSDRLDAYLFSSVLVLQDCVLETISVAWSFFHSLVRKPDALGEVTIHACKVRSGKESIAWIQCFYE